jgi:hypothetical protein
MLPGRLRLAALGAATLLTLAACGGTAPSGVATLQSGAPGAAPGGGSPAPSLDPETAQLEFARCMREHGVDVPDPGAAGGPLVIGGSGPEVEKMQEATEACNHFLEAAFGAPATPDPEMLDKMLAFAKCMREHGIDFPDPNPQGGGVSIQIGPGGPGAIDPGSDTFQKAQEACQPVLGGEGPVFGGGSVVGPGPGGGPGTDSGPGLHIVPVEPGRTPNP